MSISSRPRIIRAFRTYGLPYFSFSPFLHSLLAFVIDTGHLPSFEKNPKFFNDILFYRKLMLRKHDLRSYVDKYDARAFIKKAVGEDYLVPCQGVFEQLQDINWDILKYPVVIKPTHGSGMVMLLDSRNDVTPEKLNILKRWLKLDYYTHTGEYLYKDMKHRLIIEDNLSGGQDVGLCEYKLHCYYGRCKFVEMVGYRFVGKRKSYVDPVTWTDHGARGDGDQLFDPLPPKPKGFDKLLEVGQKLAQGWRYVRIDMYLVNGKPLVGEITFLHCNCSVRLEPRSSEETLFGRPFYEVPEGINEAEWI